MGLFWCILTIIIAVVCEYYWNKAEKASKEDTLKFAILTVLLLGALAASTYMTVHHLLS
ncbi:membrane-bound protein [Bacillus phage vB_BthM-Goe5]|nr:membrane-bound protein [Bacillus phage vB_BthM-Goe5]